MADALAMWLTAVDQPALVTDTGVGSFLDWNVPTSVDPSSGADKFFRVKNLSPALTAEGVTVSLVDPGTGTEDIARYHYLSTDNQVFTDTASLGTLLPGEVSVPVTLRRVTPSTAVGTGAAQYFVVHLNVSSWSASYLSSYVLVAGP